ncbi:MAG TPA: hypothetical protein VG073_05675 [Gaiellaceae bacterium]|nr:hypothetical protein [Gaiellaceae bacterium]
MALTQRQDGRRELLCGNCGYWVRAKVPPACCPQCQSTVWEAVRWRRGAFDAQRT